jgi:hypothetical protein
MITSEADLPLYELLTSGLPQHIGIQSLSVGVRRVRGYVSVRKYRHGRRSISYSEYSPFAIDPRAGLICSSDENNGALQSKGKVLQYTIQGMLNMNHTRTLKGRADLHFSHRSYHADLYTLARKQLALGVVLMLQSSTRVINHSLCIGIIIMHRPHVPFPI